MIMQGRVTYQKQIMCSLQVMLTSLNAHLGALLPYQFRITWEACHAAIEETIYQAAHAMPTSSTAAPAATKTGATKVTPLYELVRYSAKLLPTIANMTMFQGTPPLRLCLMPRYAANSYFTPNEQEQGYWGGIRGNQELEMFVYAWGCEGSLPGDDLFGEDMPPPPGSRVVVSD
jgi:hypothetical protein